MKEVPQAPVLDPSLPEARLERQWDNIASRIDRGPLSSWRSRAFAVGAMAVVATTAVVAVRRAPSMGAAAGEAFVVESQADGASSVVLADGSRVTVAKGARLGVVRATKTDVAMRLEAGKARFDVKHDEARRFAVQIDQIEVVDRGTRFEIARTEGAHLGVDVRVEEGEVELRDPVHPEPRRLTAGESWSNRLPGAEANQGSSATLGAGAPPSAALGSATSSSGVPAGVATLEVPATGERVASVGSAGSRSVDASERVAIGRSKGTESSRPAGARTARELFETGNIAKMSGHLQEAADAFDTLRLRHRSDAHAALAALELGRLRLNHLGDPAGALVALQDAVRLGPKAPVREEAEAKVVDALEALGRTAECRSGRDQFLARYPRSVHAGSVADKCGGR